MDNFVFYHVVTEKPMKLNQIITFDNQHHSKVYERVYALRDKVDKILANPEKYSDKDFEHHLKVAIRELALEKIRQKEFPEYPSRLASLYVSKNYKDAKKWYNYFINLGRPTYQIVKVITDGKSFTGDACNCFDGTTNKENNEEKARYYWEGKDNRNEDMSNDILDLQTIIDGNIHVIEIMLENKNTKF